MFILDNFRLCLSSLFHKTTGQEICLDTWAIPSEQLASTMQTLAFTAKALPFAFEKLACRAKTLTFLIEALPFLLKTLGNRLQMLTFAKEILPSLSEKPERLFQKLPRRR